MTEPSRVSGYFGVGRAVAAERREEVARIEEVSRPVPPQEYYAPPAVMPSLKLEFPSPTVVPAAPTPTPYYIPTPLVTPYAPPTPTVTPTVSPKTPIPLSRGLVSAGREPTRAQAPIAPEPTPAERLSAGIAKARYGK